MGALILSTVGRAVGTLIGGPIGGQLGSMLGGALAGGSGSSHHYEGARLEDLAVQTSTYGRSIPIVFGTVRLAGNIIWSLPIKETATTSTVSVGGGKGGGGQSSSSTTSYSYSVTLAIAICEGAITQLNRVWADSALVDMSQGTYRIYKGTETQLPDALIESFEGVGRTPAYRGTAYVVIEDFPLGDFGNRIPNFTFEVTRRVSQSDHADEPVENLVKSLMLIPGSGEFVYDTVAEAKVTGQASGSDVAQQGFQQSMNQHTPSGKANALVALDQMLATFPNLEWVGIAINWFGTSMNISSCEIWPCVEFQSGVKTTPNSWSVAGLTRATARLIGRDDDGNLRYGGTPDDASLLRLITAIKARGLKVFVYPMMLMDVDGKPWRGELTGSASDVHTFFTKTHGYNAFITHYATLVAGHVDAFAIGTEMKGLTAISSGTGVYPAVTELVSLAGTVKTMLGSLVKVTYAADWSEYHHTDGGWYNLDPLWACSSIDVVGIDAYFPLTDGVMVNYDIQPIIDGWTSGEGYDFYYSDEARTIQAPLDAPYAWKNIDWWYHHTHTNPNGSSTGWTPAMKPIWFTEYGFPSVDGCANEPNVFVDASTSESAYPRFSRGRVDFMAQRVAIAGTEAQWGGSSMVPQRFLWTWDARPYPYWPDLLSVWADGGNWVTGHWVEGKLGASHVAPAVNEIAARAGLPADALDTSKLQMLLDGFILHNRVTARAAIDQLQQAYFFSLRESGAELVALPIDADIDATATVEDCIPFSDDQQNVAYELVRQEDLVLPDRVEIQYLDRLASYDTEIAASSRGTQEVQATSSIALSLVLSEAQARAIADTQLAQAWAERSSITLQLPMRYAALEAGDLLQLTTANAVHAIRLQQVQIGHPGIVRIKGVVDIAQTWDGYVPPVSGGDGSLLTPLPDTYLEVLDLPAFPGDVPNAMTLRFAACGISDGWKGATIVREAGSGEDSILLTLQTPATMGSCLTALSSGPTAVFDRVNTLEVVLLGSAVLASVTELDVLNGANAAVIGNEIVQFATVTTLGAGHYVLSDLLRGRLGTEAAMATHSIGERFVLLDGNVAAQSFATSAIGQTWTLRASTFGGSLANGTESSVTIEGNSLLPLSPVDLFAHKETSGDITISWNRRARVDGSWRDYVDVPLNEESELYDISILSGSTVLRSWRVSTTSVSYTSAQQTADFGSAPSSLKIEVSQVSALVGEGAPATQTVTVS